MLNGIQLGRDAKLICDCRLDTFDTVLNHFDEVHFNSYKTSEYAYKNTEIVDETISKIFAYIANELNDCGIMVAPFTNEIVFIARENGNVYIDDGEIRFKLIFSSGDIIRFRKNVDIIEIKTMDK